MAIVETRTTTYEYDDEGRLVREVTVTEEPDVEPEKPRANPTPYPYQYQPFKPYTPWPGTPWY